MNRFEPLYVFTLLWHFRGLKSLNRSEPVWTGLCFFLAKAMKRCKPVWTGLRFFEQKPWIGVKRFEPLYVFTLLWHFRGLKSLNRSEPVWTGLCFFLAKAMKRCEPVWTALRFYVVVAFSWAKVLKSVWTGLNRFMVCFISKKPWNGVNRFEPVYVFF